MSGGVQTGNPAGAAAPLVSVVIPCHNQGRFLADALESVRAQQTHARLETVVVDDGSTDHTAEVARRYAPTHLVTHPSRAGLPSARNAGIHASRGSHLVFLDADDALLPQAIEMGLECFAAHPEAAIVFGRYQVTDALLEPLQESLPVRRADYAALLRGNEIGVPASAMFRREPLLEAGGFDPALPACEDHDLYLRVTRRHPIAFHPGLVARYRQHGSNMSGDPELMLEASLRVLRAQEAFVREHDGYLRDWRRGLIGRQRYYGYALLRRALTHGLLAGEPAAAARMLGRVRRDAPWALLDAPRLLPWLLRALARRGGRSAAELLRGAARGREGQG